MRVKTYENRDLNVNIYDHIPTVGDVLDYRPGCARQTVTSVKKINEMISDPKAYNEEYIFLHIWCECELIEEDFEDEELFYYYEPDSETDYIIAVKAPTTPTNLNRYNFPTKL